MAKSAHAKFATHVSLKGGLFLGPVDDDSVWTKILRKLISEEECELGMKLTREPISAKDYAKKVGKPVDQVGKMLWNMADHGTIFPHFVGDEIYYRLAPFVPGIYEYMLDHRTLDKEMAQLFIDMPSEVAPKMSIAKNSKGNLFNAVPVMQEIKGQQEILSHEDLIKFIKNASKITVTDCLCRHSMKMLGKGCEHPIEDTCMQLGDHAEYYIRTGRGHEVSVDEALEIADRVERAGLVHTVFTVEGQDESSYICNCCGCSCTAFRFFRQYGGSNVGKTNFRARIDSEKCVACGECVNVCPQNAVLLGTGLCSSIEEQIKIDRPVVPKKAGLEGNPNYRDRIISAGEGTAPCKTKCPAHVSVQGYIRKAMEGNYTEALEIIKKSIIFSFLKFMDLNLNIIIIFIFSLSAIPGEKKHFRE
jgi:NAD-dependent dihydropyrimidine dehydrogenase PreA subunit